MIPPYQAATEEIRRQSQTPTRLLKTAGAIGTSLVGGGAIANRILPLINKFVPGELMRKGLSKINPRLGGFVESALNNGYNLDDVRDFMHEKYSQPEEETQEHPIIKEAKIFESNFPNIAQAIANLMKSGRSAQDSASIIKNSMPAEIKKVEKQLGKDFIDFIIELFGEQQQEQGQIQPQVQQSQQMQQQAESMQGRQPIQPAPQQQGPNQDVQAFMQALERFNQLRQ